MTRYEDWKVHELRSELAVRGAITTGRKQDLIERLEAYDRNKNFTINTPPLPEPVILSDWPSTGFKQLQIKDKNTIPLITNSLIDGYFRYRMVCDGDSVGDLKAIAKGEALVQSERIKACSFLLKKEEVYFTGLVRAAMKKKVTYSYKIRMSLMTSEILNTHCECPSGKGPHGTCKHLAAVLMMLRHFKETGELSIMRTCTEQLQTFHIPKRKYFGSPTKAEAIHGKKTTDLSDPRPKKYRNMQGYSDYVRNQVLNFCAKSGANLPMKQLYDKANIQVAAYDHSYLDRPFTHYWVDRALFVTEQECKEIEYSTRKQSSSLTWHKERQWRITASRFGEIFYMTDRRDRIKLCRSLFEEAHLTTKAILHGKQYESVAVKQFSERFSMKVKPAGLFVCLHAPFLGASPDGVIGDETIHTTIVRHCVGEENDAEVNRYTS